MLSDLQLEIDGVTLHVDVCDNPPDPGRDNGSTGWILRRVDLWDAELFEACFGVRVNSDAEAFEWWDTNPEALDRERHNWLNEEADWLSGMDL